MLSGERPKQACSTLSFEGKRPLLANHPPPDAARVPRALTSSLEQEPERSGGDEGANHHTSGHVQHLRREGPSPARGGASDRAVERRFAVESLDRLERQLGEDDLHLAVGEDGEGRVGAIRDDRPIGEGGEADLQLALELDVLHMDRAPRPHRRGGGGVVMRLVGEDVLIVPSEVGGDPPPRPLGAVA
eukprot:CAMPEP_0182821582 /NCGR_PEP_ID=MMETSP0006_2-20121128/13743_1 /TAXON_ID=97485 /ORGANISM="Prymnesium parvum, Strain Texoma1" /LENGTH=187 /DNA_ID=CAMNT_0024948341 /DNA_START=146 /DNA_END=706 /DNA_ORIENTATION=+